MSYESVFAELGQSIRRQSLFFFHALSNGALGNLHRVKPQTVTTLLDSYVVERLKQGTTIAEVKLELDKVLELLMATTTYQRMIKLVDGHFPMTATGLLQRQFNLSVSEARLTLCALQISTRRHLTSEVTRAEVVPNEEPVTA